MLNNRRGIFSSGQIPFSGVSMHDTQKCPILLCAFKKYTIDLNLFKGPTKAAGRVHNSGVFSDIK